MSGLAEVLDALNNHCSFLVACHICPDGDAIGSLVALKLALARLGKKVLAVCPDEIPGQYAFLPGADEIMKPDEVRSRPEVVVALDASDMERLGAVSDLVARWSCPVVNIDHHVTNNCYGHYNYVVPDAAATGELVYRVIDGLRVDMKGDIATSILTAIMSDTGSFRYCNTTKTSLVIAAELVELGARPSHIAEHIFETRSYGSIKLLGKVLDDLHLTIDGKVAWAEISREDMERFGVLEAETEGFINYARMVKDIRIALLFREGLDGRIHVGFRSRGGVDVSQIALLFGGGGHSMAAGCTVDGPMQRARTEVLHAVENALKDAGPGGANSGRMGECREPSTELCQSSNPLE
ncbi:MAG TPA: bifunctional oligoribonuclease/PAP phosphatase NrnA [Firmicutes bacterium]|nr:bifunctional oligoribonuclease/PAP phosphatase NrnA [Bacillota bacterium]